MQKNNMRTIVAFLVAFCLFVSSFLILSAAAADKYVPGIYTVTADKGVGLKVRSSASTSGTQIGWYDYGAKVTVYSVVTDSSGNYWGKITCDGKTGYIYMQYTKLYQATETTEENTTYPVSTRPQPGEYYINSTLGLRLRSGPSTSSTTLTTIKNGTVITIISVTADSDGDYWGKTEYSGMTGYVSMAYTKPYTGEETTTAPTTTEEPDEPVSIPVLPPATDNSPDNIYQTNTKLNMRNAPSSSAGWVSSIPQGKVVAVTDITTDETGAKWGKTTYNASNGTHTAYICLSYCTKVKLPALSTSSYTLGDTVNWTVADFSQYQTEDQIDWYKMKAAGLDGVILRIGGRGFAGSKVLYSDSGFYNHYINARAAGLHIGCYFFSYALTEAEAVEEAENTISMIKKYGAVFDMPVYIDIEEGTYSNGATRRDHYNAGKEVCTMVAETFCKAIEKAGLYAGVYCNLDFAKNLIGESSVKNRSAWVAQYFDSCTHTGRVDMWQYTDSGSFSGFTGSLDLSRCYVNYPKLIAKLSGTLTTVTKPETTTKPPETTTKPPETTTKPPETTSQAPEEPTTTVIIKDNIKEIIHIKPNCQTDGIIEKYVDNVLTEKYLVQEFHKNITECIQVTPSAIPEAGTIIPADVFSSNYLTPDNALYETKYSLIQTQGGSILRYCKDCGEILSVKSIYKTNNCNHSTAESEQLAPTCTKDGRAEKKCVNCGKVIESYIIDKKGHTAAEPKLIWNTSQPCNQTSCKVCKTVLKTVYLAQGDIDANGSVNIIDARTALRVAIGLEKAQAWYTALADSDKDGKITVIDARKILRTAIGLK